MLKFWRRVRQKLIDESNPKKYFIYAVGEILLVMIGILLALQVNNWNEERKSNDFEKLLIEELLSTINADIETIELTLQGNERAQNSCNTILDHFEKQLDYNDTLNTHFGFATEWWLLTLVENAYTNAESYGMHFMKNDTTRRLLNYIYDSRIPYYQNVLNRHTKYHYEIVEPLYFEWFEPFERIGNSTTFKKIPIDYITLRENKKYHNVLKRSIRDREKENTIIRQILDLMKHVLPLLENEMK